MMAEAQKAPCYCGGVMAIVIAVLTLLAMHNIIGGLWVSIVVLVLAVLLAIGSLCGCCCCAKLCKPKEGE